MTILPRSVAFFLSFLALLCGVAHADKIYLTNGNTLEGEVLEETADHVRLRYHVTPRIQDEKQVPKSTIVKIEKVSPDVRALGKIQADLPLADRSPVHAYDDFINRRLRAFKNEFPESELHGQVDKIINDLKIERERVASGDVKIDGLFVSPKEYEMSRVRFESEAAMSKFRSIIKGGKFLDGMRFFDTIETDYAGTVAHVDAIEFARDDALPAFQRNIGQMIKLDRFKMDEVARIRRLAKEGDVSAKRAVIQIDKDMADFKVVMEKERSDQGSWVSSHPLFPGTLQKTEIKIQEELERLGEIDAEKLREANISIGAAREHLANGGHIKAIASLVKAEMKGGDEEVIAELRSEATGLKKVAEVAEAKAAELQAAKEKGLTGLFNKAKAVTGAGGNTSDGGVASATPTSITPSSSGTTASTQQAAPAPKATADPAPAAPVKPVVAASPPPQGGVPLYQKALFGLALVLIITTIGAKVLGIGGGKEKAAEEG